jgi:DNA-binding transcriptional LysR family regulator
MDWDLTRVFLAVARSGQFLAAGRILAIDHTTISRRMTALENSIGAKLIERRTSGCRLTAAGERFLIVAERVETEFLKAQSEISGHQVSISGTVRVGTPDGFGTYILARHLSDFLELYPNLRVQLVPLPRTFSLSKREADIAITIEPPLEGKLTVRKLTDYNLGLYASFGFLDRHGPILSIEDASKLRIVTYVPDLLYTRELDYLDELKLYSKMHFECAGMIGQIEAVRTGVGIGVLHDYVVRNDPDFTRILPEHSVKRAYWITTHHDVKDLARVRLVYDFIVGLTSRLRGDFL